MAAEESEVSVDGEAFAAAGSPGDAEARGKAVVLKGLVREEVAEAGGQGEVGEELDVILGEEGRI